MTNLEEFPNGIKFYQGEKYKFTKDSIDLAKFCTIKSSDNVLEMCAGSGVISFYAFALNKFNKMYLNELQSSLCEDIYKNIEINNLQDKTVVKNVDLKNLKAQDFEKKFDVIICNPPYYKGNVQSLDFSKAICKHEIAITLKEIVKKASELIKDKGKLFLCMTAERSAELLGELFICNFHAKKIRFLKNSKNEVYLVLVEAVFNGKAGTKIIV